MNRPRSARAAFLFLCLGLFLGVLPLAAEELALSASVDAEKIGKDDYLTYTVTFKGFSNPSAPDLAALSDFRVVQSMRSSEFRLINNVAESYTNFIFTLQPLKTGTLHLPPVRVRAGGKEYASESFRIEVVAGSVKPRQPASSGAPSSLFDDDWFGRPRQSAAPAEVLLKAQVSKARLPYGEPVLYTVLLYTQAPVEGANLVSSPSFPGFWQEWFPLPQTISGRQEILNGKRYSVFEIRKALLFPSRSGRLTIPAMEFDLVVSEEASFFSGAPRTLRRSTQSLEVEAGEAPAAAAGLPVGQYTYTVQCERLNVDVNTFPVVKMTIRGNGNVKTITPPVIDSGADFQAFPAKTTTNVEYQERSVSGVLQAEIPLSFQGGGEVRVQAPPFRFYDPQRRTVVTLTAAPLVFHVSGVRRKQENAVSVGQGETMRVGEDIDYIKQGELRDQSGDLSGSWWYGWLILLAFLFNLLVGLKKYVWDAHLAGHAFFRRRRVLAAILQDLAALDDFGGVAAVIDTYARDRLHIGFSAVSSPAIAEALRRGGVAEADVAELTAVRERSEQYRFAGRQGADWQGERTALTDLLRRIDGKLP